MVASRPPGVRENMRFPYDLAVRLELAFKVLDHVSALIKVENGDTVDTDPRKF